LVVGHGLKLVFGSGEGSSWRDGGIDDGSQNGGRGGFAGERWASEKEDRIGALRLEGGEEPGLDALPIALAWEIEELAKVVHGAALAGRLGEREIASADEEIFEGGPTEGPAFASDFDGLAEGVGEVEDEFVLACGDAAADGFGGGGSGEGTGFEDGDGVAEGSRVGDGLVGLEVAGEEPVAEAAGAEGPDLMGAGADGKADTGLAVGRDERRGSGGALQQAGDLLIELIGPGHRFLLAQLIAGGWWGFGWRVVYVVEAVGFVF
jgi:hypothetical protein